MTFDLRADKNRLARGIILMLLHKFGPGREGDNNIFHALDAAAGPVAAQDFDSQLAYLHDKDYIKIESADSPVGVPKRWITLRAAGVDVLEGSINDPGVMVPDERG